MPRCFRRALPVLLALLLPLSAASADETLHDQRFDSDFDGGGYLFHGGSWGYAIRLSSQYYRSGPTSLFLGNSQDELRASHDLREPLEERSISCYIFDNGREEMEAYLVLSRDPAASDAPLALARVGLGRGGWIHASSDVLPNELGDRQILKRGDGWHKVTITHQGKTLTARVNRQVVARWRCEEPPLSYHLVRMGPYASYAWFDDVQVYEGSPRLPELAEGHYDDRMTRYFTVNLGLGWTTARMNDSAIQSGAEWGDAAQWSLGVGYALGPNYQVGLLGQTWRGDLPLLPGADIDHIERRLNLVGANLLWYPDVSPFVVEATLGFAWSTDSVSGEGETVDELNFPGDTETGWGLQLGAGYQFQMGERWRFGPHFHFSRLNFENGAWIEMFGASFTLQWQSAGEDADGEI